MKTYSYAFGNHSAFLRVDRHLHTSLKLAFQAPEYGSLIYVYDEDSLVTVFELQPLLDKIIKSKKPWVKQPPKIAFDVFMLLERYIQRVAKCRQAYA